MSLERVPGPPPDALATHAGGSLASAQRPAFFSLKRRTPLGARGMSGRLADMESLMTTFKSGISLDSGTEQGSRPASSRPLPSPVRTGSSSGPAQSQPGEPCLDTSFRGQSCEKGFEMTLTVTERANAEVNCPQLRKREGHPSAHGLHSQDLAEELTTKGVMWRGSLGVRVGRGLGAVSLVCCSVQERYGNEKIHRVLGVTSSQGTKTNQPTTISFRRSAQSCPSSSPPIRVGRVNEHAQHTSEGPMKLSEAIRLGAMMMPQAFRTLLTDDGACALGAALLAVGAQPEEAVRSALNRWPWASTVSADCPRCGRSRTVFRVITHLNDRHRWTREQIAKWVAGIEPTDVFWRPCGGKMKAWRPQQSANGRRPKGEQVGG